MDTVTALYYDVTRPYLARIPGLRRILALNLLWVVRPGTGDRRQRQDL